jgi:ligand-binding SRPBCC domain-containing protein
MKLEIRIPVAQPPDQVFKGFTVDLFIALAPPPPFPPMKLKHFGGSRTGDHVELELNFLFFRQRWVSVITRDETLPDGTIYFIDEGRQLPFFLKTWKHTHWVRPGPGGGSIIVEDIEYTAPLGLLTYLLYPTLWLQFAVRKPVYQRLFGKPLVQ